MAAHYQTIEYTTTVINQLVLLGVSLFFDIFVVYHHWTSPPHPKFYLMRSRKLSILTHLISGSIEIVSAVGCFFAQDPVPWARAMAMAVVLGHVPSSFYQTPNVFGMKSVMYRIITSMFHVWG
jgi:hypothetical protein